METPWKPTKEQVQAAAGKSVPEAILATNTSCLSVTALAAATRRSDRVLGIHFFNPAPVMPLVELVEALSTSAETLQTAREFARALGKTAVIDRKRTRPRSAFTPDAAESGCGLQGREGGVRGGIKIVQSPRPKVYRENRSKGAKAQRHKGKRKTGFRVGAGFFILPCAQRFFKYKSTNSLGLRTVIPLWPETRNRCLSPLTIIVQLPASAHPMNL